MKYRTGMTFSVLLSLFLIFVSLNDAEARRFGGGGNFGGRSAYSSPYQRSVQPTRPADQTQPTARPSPAPTANPGMPNRGLMGMLGGLALGGLLGSMFMGGGFHGLNFLDMLIFGAIAFMLFKFLAARKANTQAQPYQRTASGSYQGPANPLDTSAPTSSTGFNTDILFDKNKSASSPAGQNQSIDADFANVIPAGFDQAGFLNGAKIAYKALQKAWDARDLADIRALTTDKVFAEIQEQLRASQEENHTDVLKLEAELLEVREIGNEIEAVVLFDAVMREDQGTQAGQVREVWHFVKPNTPSQTKWLLDGIQQLAD